MADNQVPLPLIRSTKELSKNKTVSSSIARNSSPRKPPQESGTTRTSDWDSKHPRKPLTDTTLIRNAHSPVTSPSGERFSRES